MTLNCFMFVIFVFSNWNPKRVPEQAQSLKRKKILFVVLNWGLGHATRTEVLIREALARGAEVHIASDGDALAVLMQSFPKQIFHVLSDYKIRYRSGFRNLPSLILSIPRVMRMHFRDVRTIRELHLRYQYDGVISDNRPSGLLAKVPSVYMTHQLRIRAGWLSSILTYGHRMMYRKFDEVWVPDLKDRVLSGALSKPISKRMKVRYIGPLSRLDKVEPTERIPWAAVLSGPEPLRSEWEKELLEVRVQLPEGGVIVRGKPEEHLQEEGVINYLDREGLSQLYANAEVVVCRSGYSSLMDLLALNKKALLVPTPGQLEQEYLAVHSTRNTWRVGEQGVVDYQTMLNEVMSIQTEDKEAIASLPTDLFRLFQGKGES
ncbi:MAG: glycosyltransferase [Bacteroidetes bacterium]|nr:MAG: glycosyltransferase [Bacteroidota bacterium]